ncbi:MAG: CheR family methyltransferase, partial [Pyrinomonadaceae bacterium]
MKKSKSSKKISENGSSNKPDCDDFLIVGIGASAGGIQALKVFFENVPADSGAAYVVILHLSPDHESRLAEVLQTAAQISVTQVTERVKVEPDHVFVVPPNLSLSMADGHIVVSPINTIEERRAPVDIFFRTLAETHHEQAVCVVLSGTGADGSMGLKRVKENGGVVFVQNPREAEYNDMARNAIATNLIDEVLNVAEIPAKIIAYKENRRTVAIPAEQESLPEELQKALRDIFTQLRVSTGHDFTNYKRPTVLRRIERRINVRNLSGIPEYAAFLREQPEEVQSLLKDLLISVTNFFRDKTAFEALENDIIPRIVHDKRAGDQIRVWVAGCATGEEAYSIAMMIAEHTLGGGGAPEVQIFATDMDEAAIATAHDGFYTLNDAADVSPERLRRFFTKEDDGYRVRRELREMVLFAHHNVLKDPPFSHLDLATCRNMLIYLNSAAQKRAMETFHFALNPGSFLFLGSSESINGAIDLFAPLVKEHNIFQSRNVEPRVPRPAANLPTPTMRFEPSQTTLKTNQEQENRALERLSYADLHQQLLEQFAPPSVVVNQEYEIIHLSERAGRFMQIPGGEPSNNLLKVIRPELRLELRTALYQAVQKRINVEAKNLPLKMDGRVEIINILVRPVLRPDDTARGFILVLFEKTEDAPEESEVVFAAHEPVARQLEDELMRVKAQLHSSIEQYETQTEELKASNEELQAMNEELRSSGEELETGKEELQSINEELVTVNQELKIKIEELSQSNSDFQNLMASTDIGTIFLDHNLRVKMFTPTMRNIINLLPSDLGRPLTDITTQFAYENLHDDCEFVLERLQAVEREIQTSDDRWLLMRVLPYRTAAYQMSGVVLTFLDITTRKQAEESLRFQAHLLNTVEQAAIATDLDGTVIYW